MRFVQVLVSIIIGGFLISIMIARPTNKQIPESNPTSVPSVTKTPTPTTSTNKMSYEGQEFRYEVETIDDAALVKLVYNYEEKKSVEEIVRTNDCRIGANGGFYDTDNKPLGLVVVNGKEMRGYRKNDLFNGIVSIDNENKVYITTSLLGANVKHAVQSGPMLVSGGKALPISLKSDELARRVVVANTADKKRMLLIVFFMEDSPLTGPYLEDLPIMLEKLNKEKSLGISEALNMDGGSASAYRSEKIKLNEWLSVGSWWCVTDKSATL